jgi:hypothetical protein
VILGLRDGPWKFTYRLDSRRPEIFNLDFDSAERHDLSTGNRDRAAWYEQVVRGWSGAQRDYVATLERE